MAQTPASIQPLDIPEGLWDVTQTSHAVAQIPPEALANFTPQQRAQILAAAKAGQDKGTVHKRTICLNRGNLIKGNILTGDPACPKQFTSTSQKLEVHWMCQEVDLTAKFQRTDAEHFTGSIQQIMNVSGGGTVNQTVEAKWIGQDCVAIDKERRQALGIASGANRDVLSFLPYIPPGGDGSAAEGRLGRFFSYFWESTSHGIPTIGYEGGIPGQKRNQVYFDGTDGTFLYVTIDSNLCASDARYKIDKNGTPTRISKIPAGLLGGKDQMGGGPPCQ